MLIEAREKRPLLFPLSFKSDYPISIDQLHVGLSHSIMIFRQNYSGKSEFSDANEIFLFWWNFWFSFLYSFRIFGVFIPFLQNRTCEKEK